MCVLFVKSSLHCNRSCFMYDMYGLRMLAIQGLFGCRKWP